MWAGKGLTGGAESAELIRTSGGIGSETEVEAEEEAEHDSAAAVEAVVE